MEYAITNNEIFIKSQYFEYGWKIIDGIDEVYLGYVEEEKGEFVEKSKVILPKGALEIFLYALISLLEVESPVDEDYAVERSLKITGATKVICIEEEFTESDWRQFKFSCDGSEINVSDNNLKVLIAYLKKCNLVE